MAQTLMSDRRMMERQMADRGYRIGIEREGLRTDADGCIALTPHPSEFGERLENFRIGTDFGEAMLEFRTKPQPDTESCYQELLEVTKEALKVLHERGEYLWPYSMPCRIPDESAFCYNSYPEHPEEEDFERLLTSIYGIRRMSISGIHFNFSVSDEMHGYLRVRYPGVPEDKDEAYMRCCRNLLKYGQLIQYFLDASPTDLDGHLAEANSFRNSPDGYRCEKAKTLDFSSKQAYAESVSRLKRYERFGPVRAKSAQKKNMDAGILISGVNRIEVRFCDINPFDICGVSRQDLDFMTALLFLCMTKEEASETGLDTPAHLLEGCMRMNRELSLGLDEGLDAMRRDLESGQKRSDKVRELIQRHGLDGFLMLAAEYDRAAASPESA